MARLASGQRPTLGLWTAPENSTYLAPGNDEASATDAPTGGGTKPTSSVFVRSR
jgi:hypothetical protein